MLKFKVGGGGGTAIARLFFIYLRDGATRFLREKKETSSFTMRDGQGGGGAGWMDGRGGGDDSEPFSCHLGS